MDGRCATCGHWSKSEDKRDYGLGGFCTRTLVLQTLPNDPESKARGSGSLFEDSPKMVHFWLSTSPDFGCIQWETRP